MLTPYMRPKNPEAVRRSLKEAAGRLAVEKGLPALSVKEISEAAGVSKGGFFHHYPSKHALIDEIISDLMVWLDEKIESHMAEDPVLHGRFTRAYVQMIFEGDFHTDHWLAIWASLYSVPDLGRTWLNWFNARLERHHDTDSDVYLEAVRFAADGFWLGQLVGVVPANRTALGKHLLSLITLRRAS